MFWVLQKNLYAEEGFNYLLNQLDRQGSKYQIVNVIPFAHEMDPDVNVDGPVFVLGATAMGKIARKKNWYPGYLDQNINYEKLMLHYGRMMFNSDSVFGTFGSIEKTWDEFFFRPVNDGKAFAGTIMTWDKLLDWRKNIADLQETSKMTLNLDDEVVMSSLKSIFAEYRFFVVDGKIITGSRYKLGDMVSYSDQVDEWIAEYAQSVVDIWAPNKAFALDIAISADDGKPYVLEINSINSAGFYKCDMGKFINAVETAQW